MKEKLMFLRNIFLLFVIFAVCGWIYEVLLTLWAYGYFENRGYLSGPWLPIYGFGGLILYFALGRFTKTRSHAVIRFIAVFFCICAVTAATELIASYILDALGTDFRTLWNYGGEYLNYDGRVALVPTLRFGVLGQLGLYVVVPLWERFTASEKQKAVTAVFAVTAALFFADLAARIAFGIRL